ncbi:D-ribose pyranase [Roseibium denhamense]|uniref:D-ribose pyranase n=1 Tax=Roseibium denhamense TaxID=76305 RepID=A0ABY1NQA4_9HYPH|nr:D-ribose pyranase [Roseibium denhamense]MTI07857.1 D-ribose pyranase [Roseibium denhamense]SMP14472.1 ribose transport protein RbsD [Roseibium denhamense]
MKRGILLNRHLSALVAALGHMDEIVVADAGLPVPSGTPVIDLAVMAGVPSLKDVLAALRSELAVEAAVYAQEAAENVERMMLEELEAWPSAVSVSKIDHEGLKARTAKARAVIRTGETTPYANLILISGVAF